MTVTVDAVKTEMDLSAQAVGLATTEFDSLLDRLIRRETSRVEDAVDVSLGLTLETADLSRPESVEDPYLPLPERPVISVENVTVDTERVAGEPVGPGDYAVESTHLELLPGPEVGRTRWPTKRRSVTVTWTHGYMDTDTPEVIEAAIIGLVRHAVQEINSDGVESESVDGQSVSYELAETVVSRHLDRANQFDAPGFYGGANIV